MSDVYLRGDGDVALGGWTNQAGGTSNIFQAIDETTTADSDFVQSPAQTVEEGGGGAIVIGTPGGSIAAYLGTTAGQKDAQTFVSIGTAISSVRVQLWKAGSPSVGDVQIKIFTVDGSHLPLAQVGVTSSGLASTSIAATETSYDFTFSPPVAVTNGTEYIFVVEVTGTLSDAPNNLNIGLKTSTGYAGGSWAYFNGTAWDNSFITYDVVSEIGFSTTTLATGSMAITDGILFGNASFAKLAQSFIASGPSIPAVRIRLLKTSSTDGVQIKIFTADGSHKPGTQVGVTSNAVAAAAIPASPTFGTIEFIFATPVPVTAGVEYCFVIERTGAVDDVANYTSTLDAAGLYAAGYFHYWNGTTWAATYAATFDWIGEVDFLASAAAISHLKVRLYDGATQIAEWTHTDIADTFADAVQTLTGPQVAAITNFANLFVELDDTFGSVYRFALSDPPGGVVAPVTVKYRYKKLAA